MIVDLPAYISQIERDFIHQALSETKGNRAQAAKLLNIKRTTLVMKLKSLALLDKPRAYWTFGEGAGLD